MQTTELTQRHPDMAVTTGVLLAGPALMAGYGVVRLAGRAVGDYGPGVWWSVAHVLFLAGVLAFVPVFLGLRRPAGVRGGGRTGIRVAAAVGLLGAAAVAVQASVDLVVGFLAADKRAMSDMFEKVQDVPGVVPAVYSVVPMLFWLGLLALVTLLAFFRRDVVPARSPLLVLAGAVTMAVSLDLLAAGALCIGLALYPVRRGPRG
ncbi:hypothetical protein P8A18_21620 [Streptomyces castrisilvae]|uniref:Integral membrane protein n=1 Tax=Streptomyces castrisilvae TaxID=3033811 RepID=A0ABY9HP19_9ACTN|nr:hypothetical protein [Streptomyces sp. Mut1]WLQ35864.1 hypothetical protein P8A18_21620 [Streptomyces sp. Mut1]